MTSTSTPIFLFIAGASATRISTEETLRCLRDSLECTIEFYCMKYWDLPEDKQPEFLTFIWQSNRILSRADNGRVYQRVRDTMTRGRETGRRVILVINGWDGLTTHEISFVDLFRGFEDANVILRVFADDPREFYEVEVRTVVDLMNGIYEVDSPDICPISVKYFQRCRAVASHKAEISREMQALFEVTRYRNTPPGMKRTETGYVAREYACEECPAKFFSRIALRSHINRKHQVTAPVKHICPHCKFEFTMKHALDRHLHQKVCKEHPEHVAKPVKERAAWGSFRKQQSSKPPVPHGELIPYEALTERPLEFPDFRETFGRIYRGEVFCRHSGCILRKPFRQYSHLRTHYYKVHKSIFPTYSPRMVAREPYGSIAPA